jgi:hypothetical protein
VLRRLLGAARNLVPFAVLRGVERIGGSAIGLLERFGTGVVDAVAHVLNNHRSTS